MEQEAIDWKARAMEYQLENETWRAQWKGFQFHQKSHWTLHIRKPEFLLVPLRDFVTYLRTTEPYKLYIYTLIVCTIVGTLAEIVALYINRES